MPHAVLPTGVGKAAVMKLVTNYFEDRRESMLDALGAQLLADVIGYQPASRVDPGGAQDGAAGRRKAAGGRPVLPVGLSLGGIALVDLLGELAGGAGRGLRHGRVAGAAAVHVRCDPVDAVRRGRPAHLPVPWLNIYDSRDFLSFVAEPLFRRTDGLASVVDLRVHSGKDFPKSHSAYWELAPGLGRDRDRVHLEADRAPDRQAGTRPRLRGAQGTDPPPEA